MHSSFMPRRRSTDLFPTDQPIPASQMIGRQTDVREITAVLAAGSSVVVAGPRRTAKTSVCDAVLGRLTRRGLYTVAIDLFRIAMTAAASTKSASVGRHPAGTLLAAQRPRRSNVSR